MQVLESTNPTTSPFRLPFAFISPFELKHFNPSLHGLHIEEKVRNENRMIEAALRELYNHIIEKSGRYINMMENDDFSEEIYWLMG